MIRGSDRIRPLLASRLALGILALSGTLPARAQDLPTDTATAEPDTVTEGPLSVFQPDYISSPGFEVPEGPLAPGTRRVFTRDSLIWDGAATLADLLAEIPGVYVARAGFLGQPEYVVYGGRGATSLEIYWDGHELEPLGGDTVYLDPGAISLTYLRRVEVHMLPASLRVYLVSERHESLSARSVISLVTGDFETAAYAGLFQKRWLNGPAINVAGNFVGTDGASGPNRNDQRFDAWAKVEWFADRQTGAYYQLRRQELERDPVSAIDEGPGVPFRKGTRTDLWFTFFRSLEPGPYGVRFDVGLGSSSWTGDSILGDQNLRKAFVKVSYAQPRISLSLNGRVGDERTNSEVEGSFGWTPVPGITVSASGRWERHDGDRTSKRINFGLGLYRGPFSLVGQLEQGELLQAAAIVGDTIQSTRDVSVSAGFRSRPFEVRAALVRRDRFQPLPFGEVLPVSALAPSPESTHLLVSFRLRPLAPLTLDGWYADPVEGALDFQPPEHTRVQLTFRSKFWRTFRSGAFDVKIALAMDAWSRGTAGLTADGTPIELRGITFYETLLEFQIVGFTAFWNIRNAYRAREQYIPGLSYPRSAQTYGVRWNFQN